ncbi:ABC transporter substrate-binding protein [Xenophilus sp. Marseille-Q4582]|uniref:ABC transporter substrate-binding protein n=1 Tax=Xenophilus sp. Marseille-Q4582 TaxID=2866600 RepID=UPI001CE46091|nr:ABC transporter substrate-binding protein [Xenophilus sp. Marseille-Q4582]
MSASQTLRVGVHPQSPAGPLLQRAPALQDVRDALGSDVALVAYAHGTQTPEHFLGQRIDVGLTGATPPLTIQAAGADIVYLGVGQPRPDSGALVVPTDSPIRSVADLRERRVGFAVGSWHSAFVALALDAQGLGYEQIQAVSYVQTGGRLDPSRVDAWVARPEDIDSPEVRVLVRSGSLWSNRSVVFARRSALTDEAGVARAARLLTALQATGLWLGRHPDAAAALLEDISPVGRAALQRGFEIQPGAEGLSRPGADFLQEQQRAADVLSRAGVFAPIALAPTLDAPLLDQVWGRVAEANAPVH